MSRTKNYNSEVRRAQSELTRQRILASAKRLFSSKGYERTTIEKVARTANVSAPTVYSLFKSKEGILRELAHSIRFGDQYQLLSRKVRALEDPIKTLKMAAAIARTIRDAEESEMGFLYGGSALFPALKKLVGEREQQRFEFQEYMVHRLQENNLLPHGMTYVQAREILWTLTGQEIYRKLVIERGWSSNAYEKWLRRTLLQSLVRNNRCGK
jgi:AcrR family transcriptional regulator